jgi:apolipoprotein N-acyltransferase
MFQRIQNLVLAIISALLLGIGWFSPFTAFIFVAWVPLLLLEDNISNNSQSTRKKAKIIWLSYLTFFVWNIGVTWWISNASFIGALLAFICNPILMCVTFMVWRNLNRRINKPWAVWLLIPIWLGFEYGHMLWDATWPWLTLGNAFASTCNWIQWYEFTGTSGGSLWVLAINILIFNVIKSGSYTAKQFVKPAAGIIVPIIFSYLLLLWRTPAQKSGQEAIAGISKTYKTLIVQPNVDPYNEKFYFEPDVQLHHLLNQLQGKLDSTIDFLVLPETYLTEDIFEGTEDQSFSFHFLRDSLLQKYPRLTIITGATTNYAFKEGEQPTPSARKFSNADKYYEAYNTGLQINREGFTYYHKSKLVPGAEIMPFSWLLKPLESFALDLGGTMGTLGRQKERTVFYSHNKQAAIAPVICYESIYPDYVADYVRNGANMIFIITNDGWWENTPGHRQHLAYARLRAIENRMEIARCANTGISCFITPTGDVEQATPYWEKATIVKNMSPNNERTFFNRFGDLISYCSGIFAILLLTWSQILRYKIFKSRKFEAEKTKH